MALRIFNVLGREKQDFKPIEEGRVSMYVCGPTVYDHAHLGHAKTYVSFDVILRYLRYSGYNVLYVQNLTDVGHLQVTGEDRILKKARQLQAKPMQIAEMYTRSYLQDMDSLNVIPPDIQPRAAGHIPEQIEMIEELIAKGHAYEVDGSVYFDVTSAKEYGKLSNRRLEEQEEGTREDVRGEKRHPADFALWKKAEPEHILRWNSPWGEGFLVGILNARQWRRNILVQHSIFTVVVLIISIRTMKTKLCRVNAPMMPNFLITGCWLVA